MWYKLRYGLTINDIITINHKRSLGAGLRDWNPGFTSFHPGLLDKYT